jgi:hypothetical protein
MRSSATLLGEQRSASIWQLFARGHHLTAFLGMDAERPRRPNSGVA